MLVLGISAYYHDSAAAIVRSGTIVAAAQEERFSRRKHDPRFPELALRYCLDAAGATLADVDRVVFYDKPFLKFERLLETYLALAPNGFASFRLALPSWVKSKLFLRDTLEKRLRAVDSRFDRSRLLFSDHHLSHAASAFYPSPFDEAAVLTLDGVGEWATTTMGIGRGSRLELNREIQFPHSLGLLYSAFTYYTGFKVNSGEYKVMGLAPYGEPRFAKLIRERLIDVKPDGTFRLDLDYFDFATGLTMTNAHFDALFGGRARRPDELLTDRHMDLAASIQAVTNEIMIALARSVARDTKQRNLCLAGGVALNCVANGELLRDGSFERIWIQPAAGDAGGALGAALAVTHLHAGVPRHVMPTDAMQRALLGPSFEQPDIERRLTDAGARFTVHDERSLVDKTAQELAAGNAVGWFQGRMEFGPRALGARSILADPRSSTMQSNLNLKIKFRESFRPFAPAVLREDVGDWFEMDVDSPYMLLVANVTHAHRRETSEQERSLFGIDKLNVPRSDIPAVTHVDYSARVQTVDASSEPRFRALLERFKAHTGCPVLVNTSFNVRGEPIVCTPEDAFRCFMGTGIDTLVVGSCHMAKVDQDQSLNRDHASAFGHD